MLSSEVSSYFLSSRGRRVSSLSWGPTAMGSRLVWLSLAGRETALRLSSDVPQPMLSTV
jgi:hypothetical protein